MADPLSLTAGKLADLEDCRRRYQLRYVARLAWPSATPNPEAEERLRLGQRFHELAQRHFLGLAVEAEAAEEPELARWWARFKPFAAGLPAGERRPELGLALTLDAVQLEGRFDLLILGEERAWIYDWKTEARPRSEAELRADPQTRLYLALAAEGLAGVGRAYRPEQISLTYWPASDPTAVVSLAYDRPAHEANWRALREVAAELQARAAAEAIWPLTDDLAECRRCAYQAYCGRGDGAPDLSRWLKDEPGEFALEPGLPR
ncbi:MAG: PD-(D/E)XK nuclease family protein [Candidatus Promineifilaceae bacterium]